MARPLLAVLALLAAAAVAWIMLAPGEDPAPWRADAPTGVSSAEEAPSAVDALPQDTTAATSDPTRDEVEPVHPSQAGEPPVETFRGERATQIQVVLEEDGTPVPGARVYVLQRDEVEEDLLERSLQSGQSTLEGVMRTYGHHYRANELGVARVPLLQEGAIIFARDGERSGFEWRLEPAPGTVELRIERDLILQVTVVDGDGAPAARAPVALRMLSDRFTFTLFTREADEHGVLQLDNLRPYLESRFDSNARLDVAIGAVLPADAFGKEQAVELSEEILAAGKARLVMPETGAVTVELVDADGRRVEEDGMVQLRRNQPGSGPGRAEAQPSAPMEAGLASFAHVGLGVELEASYREEGSPLRDAVIAAGPTRPGETVRVQIERPDRPIVLVRLQDPSGTPLADVRVRIGLETTTGNTSRRSSSSGLTGPDGSLRWELESRPADAGPEFRRTLEYEVTLEDGQACRAALELGHVLHTGVNDFGELRLVALPVQVSGRIVDRQGAPVPHARVQLQEARTVDDHGQPSRWRGIRNLGKGADPDGRFVLQGELPEAPAYRLHVTSPDHEELLQEISPVATGLELTLTAGSFLAGEILVDEDVDPMRLSVRLEEEEGRRTHYVSLTRPADEPGVARIRHKAEAGVAFDLVIATDAGEEILVLPAIVLAAGQTTRPPALQPLDLRGRLRVIELRALDPQGEPLEASFVISQGDRRRTSLHARNGVLRLPIVEALEQVEIREPRHAPAILENVRENRTVRLSAGVAITAQLPTAALAAEGIQYAVRLYAENRGSDGRSFGSGRSESFAFNERGLAEVILPAAGDYRVSLQLSYQDGNRRRSRSLSAGSLTVAGAGEVHTLSLDPEKLSEAVTRLTEDD